MGVIRKSKKQMNKNRKSKHTNKRRTVSKSKSKHLKKLRGGGPPCYTDTRGENLDNKKGQYNQYGDLDDGCPVKNYKKPKSNNNNTESDYLGRRGYRQKN